MVTAVSIQGCTAIQMISAVDDNDINVIQQKLDSGVAANSYAGSEALHAAINKERTEIAKMLIERGADVNDRLRDNTTPLINACFVGNTEIVKLLIGHGADVNAKNNNGLTALINASGKGYGDIVKLLIDHDADVNAKTDDGISALINAIGGGYTQIAKVLIDHDANVNAKTNKGITPLINAAINGDTEIAKLLIDHGADVNAKSDDDFTALINAAYHGYTEISKLLIDHGADVNCVVRGTVTPLSNALSRGHVKVAKMLLKNGAQKIKLQPITELIAEALEHQIKAEKALTVSSVDIAIEDFKKASLLYDQASEKLKRQTVSSAGSQSSRMGLGSMMALGMMNSLSAYENQRYSRQLGQYQALRNATNSGTGLEGYQRNLAIRDKSISPVDTNIAPSNSSVRANSQQNSELSAKLAISEKLSRECISMVKCLESNLTPTECYSDKD